MSPYLRSEVPLSVVHHVYGLMIVRLYNRSESGVLAAIASRTNSSKRTNLVDSTPLKDRAAMPLCLLFDRIKTSGRPTSAGVPNLVPYLLGRLRSGPAAPAPKRARPSTRFRTERENASGAWNRGKGEDGLVFRLRLHLSMSPLPPKRSHRPTPRPTRPSHTLACQPSA